MSDFCELIGEVVVKVTMFCPQHGCTQVDAVSMFVSALEKNQQLFDLYTDRHHCFKSGNIPTTEAGQIYLNFMTVL